MTGRRIVWGLTLFAAGLLCGALHPVLGHPDGAKVTNLLTTSLSPEFTPDREVRVDLVEIPPNEKLEWHRHPGEEFHYYLEGNPVVELDGAPPIVGTPGTVGHVGFQQRHQATAGDKGAKVIVFRVHTKGAPWKYVDEPGDAKARGE